MGPFVRHFVESETGLGTTGGEKRWRGRGGERRGAEERRGEERSPYLGILRRRRRRRPEAVHVARPPRGTDRPTDRPIGTERDVTADKITSAPPPPPPAPARPPRHRMTLQLCCDRPSRCAGGGGEESARRREELRHESSESREHLGERFEDEQEILPHLTI